MGPSIPVKFSIIRTMMKGTIELILITHKSINCYIFCK